MRRRPSVVTCAALAVASVLVVSCATSAPPRSGPPEASDVLRSLERSPLLDDLGIAPWDQLTVQPVFSMGFEAPDEAAPSYVTPQSETTKHERTQQLVHSGAWAHTGWLTGIAPATPEKDGPNHRGYPTVQLPRMGREACRTPCVTDLWVWLDVAPLARGQWFSLATFALEPSDRWARVVTVNVGSEGWLHLFHVPSQGRAERLFQTEAPFPMRRWVRVTTYLDLSAGGGAAAVWQDGKLASVARVEGGDGTMPQAHFGLYAPPELLEGRVVNDDLSIWRVVRR